MSIPRLYWFEVESNKPTVVLIHNTWSSYKAFRRHIKFLNELGYTCVAFDLKMATVADGKNLVGWLTSKKLIYKIWRDEVTTVLNEVSGDKIIYGFSCPAMGGLLASDGRSDVKAVICDGGPFDDMWDCTYRLFEQFQSIPSKPLRHVITSIGVWRYGYESIHELSKVLARWPHNRPILSIRGDKDPLVYPECIEKIFAPHQNLNITKVHLPEGRHLDGLKNFPEIYKPTVTNFLNSIS